MLRRMLIRRSASHYWRTHVPVMLGAAIATATVTGALLVGDSMRASLRDAALRALGNVDHALVSNRYISEDTAADLDGLATGSGGRHRVCPLILLSGGIAHAESGARANRVSVLGINETFWEVVGGDPRGEQGTATGRVIILNEPLAQQLMAAPGDDVLVRLGGSQPIPTETLLGRRDEARMTLRLSVHSVVPAEGAGRFSLKQHQALPYNAWIPLETLQKALQKPGRVNAILVSQEAGDPSESGSSGLERMQRGLQNRLTLEDLGLSLRIEESRGFAVLESESLLIEPVIEEAALQAAMASGLAGAPILTYLANRIGLAPAPESSLGEKPEGGGPAGETTLERNGSGEEEAEGIPYSTVTAVGPEFSRSFPLMLIDGSMCPPLDSREVFLNEWAAEDLHASPGDTIELTYYVTGLLGSLETRRSSFRLRGIVGMEDCDADLTPSFPGVTDAENLSEWDSPFPIDMGAIRDKDEAYWDRYGTAPKAFISLVDGRGIWTTGQERFGQSTSVRIATGAGDIIANGGESFRAEIRRRLSVASLGLSFDSVKKRALAASAGSTDFGMLFVSFSFFLIASAAMLIALLFRLGAERRTREMGVFLAMGFTRTFVTRYFVMEGLVVSFLGGALGLAGAIGYAWLMLAGLRTWWSGAVGAPFLRLATPPQTFAIGLIVGVAIATVSIAASVRSLTRLPASSLLAQSTLPTGKSGQRRVKRRTKYIGFIALIAAGFLIGLSALNEEFPETVGFFGGGSALMVALLCVVKAWLEADRTTMIGRSGTGSLARLGLANASRHTGRSLLIVVLIASCTFLITSIESFHLDTDGDTTEKSSATGGFALVAESAVALPHDITTQEGRVELGISETTSKYLGSAEVIPFRLRRGDDTSCRDLYRPSEPRIVGASRAMLDRGGFTFASVLSDVEEWRLARSSNPWKLLTRDFADGAIPAIGDEAAVKWQLHSGLGKDVTITDEHGQAVDLRFVALLGGSVLQGELIVAESRFVELFPSISGHAFFLIDVPAADAADLSRSFESELRAFAMDVQPAADRLAEFMTVQNTYLSTFQTLGGLGLVLGSAGLAIVLLRNVWERRGELALMRALGFSHAALGALLMAENLGLVVAGLVCGAIPALVAVSPHVLARPSEIPWWSLGLTLGGVLIVGVGTGAAATVMTLRVPLLPALRRE